jgi:hypothetical protein
LGIQVEGVAGGVKLWSVIGGKWSVVRKIEPDLLTPDLWPLLNAERKKKLKSRWTQ